MSNRRTLDELQRKFVNRYFPGGEGLSSDPIRLHDAAHQWANVSPTEYGEQQQFFVDAAGTRELAQRTGARGFVNSAQLGDVSTKLLTDFEFFSREMESLRQNVNRINKEFNKGSDLSFEELNSPQRTYRPEISEIEANQLQNRGKEFYGQIAESLRENASNLDLPPEWRENPRIKDTDDAYRNVPFNNGARDVDLPVNRAAWSIHQGGSELSVAGGYDKPGALPYGSSMQFVQPPVHPGIDQGLFRRLIADRAGREIEGVLSRDGLDDAGRAKKFEQIREAYGLPESSRAIDWEKTKSWTPQDLRDAVRNGEVNFGLALQDLQSTEPKLTEGRLSAYQAQVLPSWAREMRPGEMESVLRLPRSPEASSLAATAREIGRVRTTARATAGAAAGVAGSIPWLDPDFRNAVERDDLGKAAGAVVRDYAAGAAVTPIAGAAAGVAQRLAPRATSRAMPALLGAGAVTRAANPLLGLTMIPGTSPIRGPGADPRREAADRAAVESQRRRAEAARARGGRWRIGSFVVPELGISESGGLFIGGGAGNSARPVRSSSRSGSSGSSSQQGGWLGWPQQVLRRLTGGR